MKLQCAEGACRERQGAPKAPAGSALVWRLESAEGARHAGVNVRAEGAPHVLNSFLGKCVYGTRKGQFFSKGRLRRAPSAQAFGQAFGHNEPPLAIAYATIAARASGGVGYPLKSAKNERGVYRNMD